MFFSGAQPIFTGKLLVFKGGYKCSEETHKWHDFLVETSERKYPGSILVESNCLQNRTGNFTRFHVVHPTMFQVCCQVLLVVTLLVV